MKGDGRVMKKGSGRFGNPGLAFSPMFTNWKTTLQ
jgi:hypothetical protein